MMLNDWIRDKTEFHHRWYNILRIGIGLLVIAGLVCTSLFFHKSEYKEWLVQEHADLEISIPELKVNSSDFSLYTLTLNSNKIADCYKMNLNLGKNYEMEIKVYSLDDTEYAEGVFENQIEETYTRIQKSKTSVATNRQYMPTVKYDRAIGKMTQLNNELWMTQKAYALYELNINEYNVLFLQYEKKIVIIETNIAWNEDVIENLRQWIIENQ